MAVLRLEIKPDGSDVLVGADTVGKSPIANNVFVDPGEVIVSVKHDGFVSVDKRVMVGKGTEQAVEIALTPKDDAASGHGAGRRFRASHVGDRERPTPTPNRRASCRRSWPRA